MIVYTIERLGDRGIGVGQREEGLPPQPTQNAGLGKANPVLGLRLGL
ncbi:hypothetical protein [Mesorhizobium sp. A623]